MGEGTNAAFSLPSRYSRTREWAPSAPISKFPVSLLPSSNVTVTVLPSESTVVRRFPYCKQLSGQSHQWVPGGMEVFFNLNIDARRDQLEEFPPL